MPNRYLGKVPTNSTRKRQVDQAVANGWNLQEIASHLGCTIKVVQYYASGRGSHVQRFIACSRCKTVIFTITGRAIHHPHDPTVLCLACLRKKRNPTFGQRLKAYRLAAGLSKAELAPRIGDRANNLENWERDCGIPQNWRPLALLACVLGIGLLTDPPIKSGEYRRRKKR